MANANYNVSLTLTAAPNFGTSSGWGYLQVTNKTTSGFTIVLHDSDGTAKNAPTSTTVDYIAIPNN